MDVYQRPYDASVPMLCMDEASRQLLGEVRQPIPMAPGRPARMDDEYIRNGVAQLFVAVEPLAGKRYIEVEEQRTKVDWAKFIKQLLDEKYPDAGKVVLVMDNLNTHSTASLYEAFAAQEAQRLAKRLEIHYTPKHGSWLNIAEIELSVLQTQCLGRRIADIDTMRSEIAAWQNHRNNSLSKINWQFTTADARVKLHRLYPKL